MKKTSIVLISLFISSSLLQASSQEDQSMKCGASMDMKEKKVQKESSMKCGGSMDMEQKAKKKLKEKSNSKCGAQHMKMSAGKCGTDN